MLCRDCAALACRGVPGHRHLHHPQLLDLTIAHIDCDAFYASVEKRDRPELAHRPVIVGGGARGVVTTACYIARLSGVRSAMPMFQALKRCPDAVVIAPDIAKYSAVARQLRQMMTALTPLMQPLSIDEAVLDLAGTQSVHRAPPAVVLARLAARVETELGITLSIGLAPNRLLAKLAAEQAKPRGFFVLGDEAAAWLAPQPVGLLPGIGPAQVKRLAALGITRLAELQALTATVAQSRLGAEGPALVARATGIDSRPVQIERQPRSISAETTFAHDLTERAALEHRLWLLCERLATRLREAGRAAGGVTLKLKTARFASRARAARLPNPTVLPELLFDVARTLLARELDGTAFRLIGISARPLHALAEADPTDLADPALSRRIARQAAIDTLRTRFGATAIARGRGITLVSGRPKHEREGH